MKQLIILGSYSAKRLVVDIQVFGYITKRYPMDYVFVFLHKILVALG